MPSRAERITFPGSQGHELAARLDLPDATPLGYALFAHCFSCSKDVLTASRLSAALTARGIALLRFDFTGLGSSQGDFANTNFSSNVQDLLQAADFMRKNYQAPQLIIGHSLGGAAVLAVAGEIPEVRAVVTLNAPSDPAHVSHLFQSNIDEINAKGEAEVMLAGRKFRIQRQFLEDIAEQNVLAKVAALRKPLLIFHSPVDTTVSIEHAAKIFMAAKHPKSFISLDDADHMLSRPADAEFVAGLLSSWASRYIVSAEKTADSAELPQGVVRVAETGDSPFTQEVRVGSHRFTADEPLSYGGKDLGPSPYDLLLAGLGACTAMTIRMYAERKQLPLEKVSVDLKHDKIHAADCEECETREGKIDRIEREIHLSGDLDTQQQASLLAIADKCPVHRTLHSEISIRTRLAQD
jgi:putative redox protein